MAILKHLSSKNANYGNAIEYLTQQYDEKLNNPILDKDGFLQEREEYRIAYFNSSGEKDEIENWERDCIRTNIKYGKNKEENDIKSHQYILAFEDEDNLSIDEVQKLGEEFGLKHFPGHQMLVAAHPGHAHIIINSVRDKERSIENWMERREDGSVQNWEYKAGMKHHAGDDYIDMLKMETMIFCEERGLGQVDLLPPEPKGKRITDKEYYANKRAHQQGKLGYKEYIRNVIEEGKEQCSNIKDFFDYLENHNVLCEKRGSFLRFKTTDGERWIRGRSLGADYDLGSIEEIFLAEKGIKKDIHREWEETETRRLAEIDWQRLINKAKKEGSFSVPTYTKKRTDIPYSISFWHDDGTPKSLVECLLTLAVTVATGEIPEFALPEWQRQVKQQQEKQTQQLIKNDKSIFVVMIVKEKVDNLKLATQYAREENINTFADLNRQKKNPALSLEQKNKIAFIQKQLDLTLQKKYLYEHQPAKSKKRTVQKGYGEIQ